MTINLTAGSGTEATDGTNTLQIAGDFIEQVKGGTGNDLITGNSLNNTTWGYGGNDTIFGGAGSDILDGNNGDGFLDGGDGNDHYGFGAGGLGTVDWGHDVITGDSSGAELISFLTTKDLTINLNAGVGDEVTDGTNTVNWTGNIIENATGADGNDVITGNALANVLIGNTG